MSRYILLIVMVAVFAGGAWAQEADSKTALLIIDVQNFYFPGGKAALVEPEKAAKKAAEVLAIDQNRKSAEGALQNSPGWSEAEPWVFGNDRLKSRKGRSNPK